MEEGVMYVVPSFIVLDFAHVVETKMHDSVNIQ